MRTLISLASLAIACSVPRPPAGALVCPTGAPDVSGAVVALHAGLDAVAIDRHARVAVSSAAGTFLLDEHGRVAQELSYAGKLAFDSKGDLVIAGRYAGVVDFGGGHALRDNGELHGFVVMLDRYGNHLWSRDLGDVTIAAVSIDPADHITLSAEDGSTLDPRS